MPKSVSRHSTSLSSLCTWEVEFVSTGFVLGKPLENKSPIVIPERQKDNKKSQSSQIQVTSGINNERK
jgi:hypothetical protein